MKPANILIPINTEKGTGFRFNDTKLADLGLARSVAKDSSLTQSGIGLGSLGYMSPEQASNFKNAGKPADIYSMGATLYALLSGIPPFSNESPSAFYGSLNRPHTPIRTHRPFTAPPIADLIDRCLEKDPRKRFHDAEELLTALNACRSARKERAKASSKPPTKPAPSPKPAEPPPVRSVRAEPIPAIVQAVPTEPVEVRLEACGPKRMSFEEFERNAARKGTRHPSDIVKLFVTAMLIVAGPFCVLALFVGLIGFIISMFQVNPARRRSRKAHKPHNRMCQPLSLVQLHQNRQPLRIAPSPLANCWMKCSGMMIEQPHPILSPHRNRSTPIR